MGKKVEDLFDHLKECTKDSVQGSIQKLKVSKLRPTQNGVGMDEIYVKKEKLAKKAKKDSKLKDYLIQRPVPIIIGNDGKFYLIDHHHLAFSVWEALGDIYLPVEVIKNWSDIEDYSFWKAMRQNNWLYPFSGSGSGPLPPNKLKEHVKDLENDIFRSLSWVVRQKYGYVKSPANAIFAEFKWGNFYRSRIIFDIQMKNDINIKDLTLKDVKEDDEEDYEKLVELAMYLATSKEAQGLPGYRG